VGLSSPTWTFNYQVTNQRSATELQRCGQTHRLHKKAAGIAQQVQSRDRRHNTKNTKITNYRCQTMPQLNNLLARSTRAEEYPPHPSQQRRPVCHPPTNWESSHRKMGAKGGEGNDLTIVLPETTTSLSRLSLLILYVLRTLSRFCKESLILSCQMLHHLMCSFACYSMLISILSSSKQEIR
jgi:hypothetical protein